VTWSEYSSRTKRETSVATVSAPVTGCSANVLSRFPAAIENVRRELRPSSRSTARSHATTSPRGVCDDTSSVWLFQSGSVKSGRWSLTSMICTSTHARPLSVDRPPPDATTSK